MHSMYIHIHCISVYRIQECLLYMQYFIQYVGLNYSILKVLLCKIFCNEQLMRLHAFMQYVFLYTFTTIT